MVGTTYWYFIELRMVAADNQVLNKYDSGRTSKEQHPIF